MEILLVEDNEADRRIMQEALNAACKNVRLRTAEDGEKVLRIAARMGEYAEEPRVDLILLDLNLPGAAGQDVLRELKDNPTTKRIPVIILTSSTFQEDIDRCYDLGANCYINKPMRYKDLVTLMTQLCDFWGKEVRYSR